MGINIKLKGARVAKGLTQEEMAEALGLSRWGYVQKENGTYNFTETEIKDICHLLDKEVTDIFFN